MTSPYLNSIHSLFPPVSICAINQEWNSIHSLSDPRSICSRICKISKEMLQSHPFLDALKTHEIALLDLSRQLFRVTSEKSMSDLSKAYMVLAVSHKLYFIAKDRTLRIFSNEGSEDTERSKVLEGMVQNINRLADLILKKDPNHTVFEVEGCVSLETQNKLLVLELASTSALLKSLIHKATKSPGTQEPLRLILQSEPLNLDNLKLEIKNLSNTILRDPRSQSNDYIKQELNLIDTLLNPEENTKPYILLKLWGTVNERLERMIASFNPQTEGNTEIPASVIQSDFNSLARLESSSDDHKTRSSDLYDQAPEDLLQTAARKQETRELIHSVFDQPECDIELILAILPRETPQDFYLELCQEAAAGVHLNRLHKLFQYPHFSYLRLDGLLDMQAYISDSPQHQKVHQKLSNRIQVLLENCSDTSSKVTLDDERKEQSANNWVVVPQPTQGSQSLDPFQNLPSKNPDDPD